MSYVCFFFLYLNICNIFSPIMFEIFLFSIHLYFLYVEERFSGHEFEQAPGDSEGQGSLACCSPWGRKKSGMTERPTLSFPFCKMCFK